MRKKAAKVKTRPWDAAEHMTTEADMAVYLNAALEDGDPTLIAAALGDLARAAGMSQIARETGPAAKAFAERYTRTAIPNFPRCSKSCARPASACAQQPMLNEDFVFTMDQADDLGRRRTLGVANRGKEGRECLSKAEDESSFATDPGLTPVPVPNRVSGEIS